MSKIEELKQLEVQETELLREFVSMKLYDTMSDIHAALCHRVDEDVADDIIINALAINLGHAIGQLDVKQQKRYAALAKQLLKEYTLMGTMLKGQHDHGNIGHA